MVFRYLSLPALALASANVLHLTDSTFEEKAITSGTSTIVKFFAPWCGHCKALAPTWASLADKYKDDPSVQIADVDCTTETAVCEKYEVKGYPTIKYFTQETGAKGEDYNGGREMGDLSTHVEEKMAAKCLVEDTKKCTDKEKEYIEKMKKGGKDVKAELKRLEGMAAGSMKADKKVWLMQRKAILKQMEVGKKEDL